ncbi:MAG: hypothetical protein V3R41_03830 [Gammaproteobacteria bacterium]
MNTLIGISSPAMQMGKDSVADWLCEAWGFKKLSMVDPLKKMLRELYKNCGVNEVLIWECLWGSKKEEPCPFYPEVTNRWMMQTLGTEWGRDQIGNDFWVSVMPEQIGVGQKIVFPDVRFIGEANMIKRRGGIMVQVIRPGVKIPEGAEHSSEGGLDDYEFDAIILNDTTLENLKDKVDTFVNIN